MPLCTCTSSYHATLQRSTAPHQAARRRGRREGCAWGVLRALIDISSSCNQHRLSPCLTCCSSRLRILCISHRAGSNEHEYLAPRWHVQRSRLSAARTHLHPLEIRRTRTSLLHSCTSALTRHTTANQAGSGRATRARRAACQQITRYAHLSFADVNIAWRVHGAHLAARANRGHPLRRHCRAA